MLQLLVAAPFLAPGFRNVLAAEGAVKKRVVLYMTHTGYASEYWFPEGANRTAMNLTGTSLESLAAVKNKLTIVKNVRNAVGEVAAPIFGGGDHHGPGSAAAYAAQQWGGFVPHTKGISLDQHIVNKVGFATPRRNLALAVGENPNYVPVFYKAKGSPASFLTDPYEAINNVFGSFTPGKSTGTPVTDLEQQRSMLDAISGDINRLSKKLAGPERSQLEAHLSLVRSSEMSLGKDVANMQSATCAKLAAPTPKLNNSFSATNFPALARIQVDLIAMAMACDISRVFCLQALNAYPNEVMSWEGVALNGDALPNDGAQGLHRLAHSLKGTPDRVLLGKANGHYASVFAYLLKKLDSIPDGNGATLLDNSISMMSGDYGDSDNHMGTEHSFENLPILLGGRGGGFFKSGQFVEGGRASHTQVMGAIMSYFGIDRSAAASAPGDGAFGDPGFSYAPLPGLIA
jgi:hypothetical protein